MTTLPNMRVLLTYHSNAIEGNALSLYETKMVIEERVTISGQPLRYYLEARNHAEALDQVRALAEKQAPITTATVLLLHRLMTDDVLPDAGQWRAGYVHIRGANYTPPHPREVPQLMADWVAWLDDEGLAFPPVLRAALAHVVFEAIHPFSDGNGRVGRLLLNLTLMSEGFPPALLPLEWRTGYIHGLHLAQTSGNHTPICNLIGRAVERALDRYLESIEASDAIPLPLSEVAERSG
jgi:Fic family protein